MYDFQLSDEGLLVTSDNPNDVMVKGDSVFLSNKVLKHIILGFDKLDVRKKLGIPVPELSAATFHKLDEATQKGVTGIDKQLAKTLTHWVEHDPDRLGPLMMFIFQRGWLYGMAEQVEHLVDAGRTVALMGALFEALYVQEKKQDETPTPNDGASANGAQDTNHVA